MATTVSHTRSLENGTRLTTRDIKVIEEAVLKSKFLDLEMLPLCQDPSKCHHLISSQDNSKIDIIQRTKRFLEEFRKCLITVEGIGQNLWGVIGYRFPPTDTGSSSKLMQHLKGFSLLPDPFTDEFFRCLNVLGHCPSCNSLPSGPESLYSLMTNFLSAYRSVNGAIETSVYQCWFANDIQISAGYLLFTLNQLKQQLQFLKEQMDEVDTNVRGMTMAMFSHSKAKTVCGRLGADSIAAIDHALNAALQAGPATLEDVLLTTAGYQSQVDDYFEFSDAVLNLLLEFQNCLTITNSKASNLKSSIRGKDQLSLRSLLEDLRDPFSDTFFHRLDALGHLPSPLVGQAPTGYSYEERPRADGFGRVRRAEGDEDIATFHSLMFQMLMSKYLPLHKSFCSQVDAYTSSRKTFKVSEFERVALEFSARLGELETFLKRCADTIAEERSKVGKAFMVGGSQTKLQDTNDRIGHPLVPTGGAPEMLHEDVAKELHLRLQPMSSTAVGLPVASGCGEGMPIRYPSVMD